MNKSTDEVTIVIYTHPDCEFSAAAKAEFKELGIPFKEIDVTVVPGASEELMRITGGEKITPVIVEGDRVTIGYRGMG